MPGRQSHGPLKATKPKPSKSDSNLRRKKRSLNAFSIAEKHVEDSPGISRARLGELDPRPSKKSRLDGENDDDGLDEDNFGPRTSNSQQKRFGDGEEDSEISDSDGEDFKVGKIDSEDDSEIDSDEAMGESDEERFEGFVFRGSTGGRSKKPQRATTGSSRDAVDEPGDIDLNEQDMEEGEEEEEDDLGEDAVDFATVLDQGSDDEDMEDEDATSGKTSSDDRDSSDAESDLSGSEDGDQADPEKISSLRQLVSNLEDSSGVSSTVRHAPSAHESMPPSEFALSTKNKLTIADLLPTVTDSKLRKSLKALSNSSTKPSSKRSGIPGKLDVPLPRRQQERLDRAAAYDKAKETLNRWIDTVKHNRRAEHLSFPLQDPNASVPQGKDKLLPLVNSRPVNGLESTIQNILEESGLAPGPSKAEDEEFAELEANRPSLEETQARRVDLRRARDLLFREEQRAKRIKKIKSKTYRKVHRRARDRMAQKDAEDRAADGIEDSEEEKERNDRRRAEERMGARHRESRWAKGIKDSKRAMWDEDARNGVQEMARRGEELKRRIQGQDVEKDEDGTASDDDSASEGGDDESEDMIIRKLQGSLREVEGVGHDSRSNPHLKSSLHNMDFMLRADAAQKERNNEAIKDLQKTLAGESPSSEEEDSEGEGVGRRLYGPLTSSGDQAPKLRQTQKRQEFEEGDPSDQEQEETENYQHRSTKNSKFEQPPSRSTPSGENPFRTSQQSISRPHLQKQTSRADLEVRGQTGKSASDSSTSSKVPRSDHAKPPASSFKAVPTIKTTPSLPSLELSDESEVDNEDLPKTPTRFTSKNTPENMARAFAGDDVEVAFATEKSALIESEGPQTEDTTLPGWGRWAGPSLSKKTKAFNSRNRFLTTTSTSDTVDAQKRKDRKLDKVIINERRQKKGAKYLAPQLPHPFETKGQYERSLRLPVGPEWGTKETFQGMTKPRVVVRQGVIRAMERPLV